MKGNNFRLAVGATAMLLTAVPAGAAVAHGTPAGKPRLAHHGTHGNHRKARRISFTATVVRANAKGLVLRTAAGRLLSFSASQIRTTKPRRAGLQHGPRAQAASDLTFSSGGVVINVLGLQPGAVVDVTETVSEDGSITITITLPPAAALQQASGVVTDVEEDAFTVVGPEGAPLHLHMAPDKLSHLELQDCTTVDLTYHMDSGVLIADSAIPTGTSRDGACAPTTDTDGVITQVSSNRLSIDTGHETVTYSIDPASGLTDGYQRGDLVDVTSTTNPDGSLQAICVSFVEREASGPVTAVTTSVDGGSLTLQDSHSGNPVTVFADPNNGVEIHAHAFNGIMVGDEVSVTYHQSAGQLIADTVSD